LFQDKGDGIRIHVPWVTSIQNHHLFSLSIDLRRRTRWFLRRNLFHSDLNKNDKEAISIAFKGLDLKLASKIPYKAINLSNMF